MLITATPQTAFIATSRASNEPKESAPAEEPQDRADIRKQVGSLGPLGPTGRTSLARLGQTGEKTGLSLAGKLAGPVGMVGTMGAIEVVNGAMGHSLNALAIVPRETEGLIGIATAPFLHGSFSHYANNAVGILLAGGMIAASDPKKFRDVSLITALSSGLGVWVAGAGPTVGASGMAYGYIGYNLARGLFERTPGNLAKTALTVALFAGSLGGMLPTVSAGISWQAHLFGFVGGVAAAALLPKDAPRQGPRF